VLGASTHSFELMLAAFIAGLALGALWIARRVDALADPVRFLGIVQVVMGVIAALTLPMYVGTFDAMAWTVNALNRTAEGWVFFNIASASICAAVMLPATFMAGMTLPLITLMLLRSRLGESSVGHVYAANTLGGIVGVIIAVYLGLPVLGLKGALLLGAAIDVLLGLWLLFALTRNRRLAWACTAAGFLALAGVATFTHLDARRLASGVYTYGRAER